MLAFIVIITPSLAQESYLPGQVVVLVKETGLGDNQVIDSLKEASPVAIISAEKLHQGELKQKETNYGPRLITLYFDEKEDPKAVSEELSKNFLVIFAEPDYLIPLTEIPNDPLFSQQWGLSKIDAPDAWDQSTGNSQIVIAIIDTGADLDHEDLVSKLLPGYDFVGSNGIPDAIPEDDSGHGTHMAGIAAAATNNGIGVAGTCPDCMILPLRACYNTASGPFCSSSKIYLALEFAVNNPLHIEGIPENPNVAQVISMSFGSPYVISSIQTGVADAYAAGAILIAGAGNDNTDILTYPAAYPGVISVAATDQNDVKAGFSNYGSWVDVAAPGVQIMTTSMGNSYAESSGTSPATPCVAGTAALMLSLAKEGGLTLTQEQVSQILIDTSDPTSEFPALIGGRINAHQALMATPHNHPPVLDPLQNSTVFAGQQFMLHLVAHDEDDDTIIFGTDAESVLPSPFTFDSRGYFWWTPSSIGTYQVTFTASDGHSSDSQSMTIRVIKKPKVIRPMEMAGGSAE
jgi:thermitase